MPCEKRVCGEDRAVGVGVSSLGSKVAPGIYRWYLGFG